jgi:NMD protein affecting ribosome stability and mRNA decay
MRVPCSKCGTPTSLTAGVCNSCIIEMWCESERQIRGTMIELFQSELNEPTEAIWQRITK